MVRDYPSKIIILDEPDNIPIEELEELEKMANGRLILALWRLDLVSTCRKKGYKFFLMEPVTTFEQLKAYADIGVEYVYLAPPLTHQLDKVAKFDVKVRAIPFMANQRNYFVEDGVRGQWIRPENVPDYEPYISTLEFYTPDLARDKARFRIYQKQEWMGELGLLVPDLNHSGSNYLISPEYTAKRMFCGQRCMIDDSCHKCYLMLDLANANRIQYMVNEEV